DRSGTAYAHYSYACMECRPYRLVRFLRWSGLWFRYGLEFVRSRLQCEPAGEYIIGSYLLADLSGRLHPLRPAGDSGHVSDLLEAAGGRRTAGGGPEPAGRLRLFPDRAAGAERHRQ